MIFKGFRNMLERHFIIYCDFKCSLIPTDTSDKIAKHTPNNAASYFVCTLDNTRNQYYKFEGGDCIRDMPEQLRRLATRCVKEQRENEHMTLTAEDTRNHFRAKTCYIFAEGLVQNQTKKLGATTTERATIEVQPTTLVILIIFLTDIYPSCFTTFAATTAI